MWLVNVRFGKGTYLARPLLRVNPSAIQQKCEKGFFWRNRAFDLTDNPGRKDP